MCWGGIASAVSSIVRKPKVKIDEGPSAAELEAAREAEAKKAAEQEAARAAATYGRAKQNSIYTGTLGVPNRTFKL